MSKNNILLALAALLIIFGWFKPNLSLLDKPNVNNNIVVVVPPSDIKLREVCEPVISSLKNGGSTRVKDGLRLSDLYLDLATLIELDGEDLVIKTTDDIRFANSLSGPMLKMDLKGKYPTLAKDANGVVVASIGEDSVPLDPELRTKAAEGFRALAWACVEGTK